jgi:predicted DCC family thiol-disulfide oxidoreductase YuxK
MPFHQILQVEGSDRNLNLFLTSRRRGIYSVEIMPSDTATRAKLAASRTTAAGEHPVIFFDGVCGLCNAWIDFVIVRDTKREFRYSALQGETARDWLQIAPADALDSVTLVDETGTYRKSDAVWRILARLGGIWRVLAGLLRIVPRPIRNWGYDFVARRRYRWFGRKESCRLPTPGERDRFLP